MVIEEKPGYAARLADCAEEASRRFLRRLGMGWGEIDLVVPAPSSPDFLDALVTRLGLPGDRVAYITEDLEGAYTAGPIAALQAAIKSGRLGEARTTLMLAAGAGITVALALYRQETAAKGPGSEGPSALGGWRRPGQGLTRRRISRGAVPPDLDRGGPRTLILRGS